MCPRNRIMRRGTRTPLVNVTVASIMVADRPDTSDRPRNYLRHGMMACCRMRMFGTPLDRTPITAVQFGQSVGSEKSRPIFGIGLALGLSALPRTAKREIERATN